MMGQRMLLVLVVTAACIGTAATYAWTCEEYQVPLFKLMDGAYYPVCVNATQLPSPLYTSKPKSSATALSGVSLCLIFALVALGIM